MQSSKIQLGLTQGARVTTYFAGLERIRRRSLLHIESIEIRSKEAVQSLSSALATLTATEDAGLTRLIIHRVEIEGVECNSSTADLSRIRRGMERSWVAPSRGSWGEVSKIFSGQHMPTTYLLLGTWQEGRASVQRRQRTSSTCAGLI